MIIYTPIKGVLVMKNITNSSINRLIRKSILEILLVVIILIISYTVFTNANLSTASLIAKNYDESQYNVYVMYGKTASNNDAIALNENIIDQGELSIKNPNKTSIYADIVLMVKDEKNINWEDIKMTIDGKIVDLDKKMLTNGYYEIDIKTIDMQAYETYKNTITLFGNPLENPKIDYTFKIIESFYR